MNPSQRGGQGVDGVSGQVRSGEEGCDRDRADDQTGEIKDELFPGSNPVGDARAVRPGDGAEKNQLGDDGGGSVFLPLHTICSPNGTAALKRYTEKQH